MDEEQPEHLARVKHKIGILVLAFLDDRVRSGRPEFVISELHEWIRERAAVAPASPDRILRALRAEGRCHYDVIDRRASRYRVVVPGEQKRLWV